MSKTSQETLSVLMDGENSALELQWILKSLGKDDSLSKKWNRYHVVRSVLKNETHNKDLHLFRHLDIAANVTAAIESNPSVKIDGGAGDLEAMAAKKRWFKVVFEPLANVVVAASVSAMVVFGWQAAQQSENNLGGAEHSVVANISSVQPGYPLLNYNGYPASDGDFSSIVFSGGVPVSQTRDVIPQWWQQEVTHYGVYNEGRLIPYIMSHSLNMALNTATGEMAFARIGTLKH
ncbi:MAG: hypothetical protein JKY01_13515 [Pseudomonadales bacterium]|nr:hypothetical protein [Pseudomonadales bacterium]